MIRFSTISLFLVLLLGYKTYSNSSLPKPWSNGDIGVSDKGEAKFNNKTFVIKGFGNDIWGLSDQFHFAYQKIEGNCELIAQITSQARTSEWAKAGLMIRNSLDSNSQHVMLFGLPDKKIGFEKRETKGGHSILGVPVLSKNSMWLKLRRYNDYFIAYESCNGKDWTILSYSKVKMDGEVFAGLAVSSNNDKEGSEVTFANVNIWNESAWNIPSPPQNLSPISMSRDKLDLKWDVSPVGSAVIVGYEVFKGKEKINPYLITSNYFTIPNLLAGTEYDFTVRGVDVTGSATTFSAPLRIKFSPEIIKQSYTLPLDNPYQTKYNSEKHWSGDLKWNTVKDVTEIKGLVKDDYSVDSVLLHKTIASISSKGGGVLFFPPGRYYFDYNVQLLSGVIIRGANPVFNVNSESSDFYLSTKFEFPQYKASNTESGSPVHAAFKKIISDTVEVQNFGLVNLDINRATIEFLGGAYARAMVKDHGMVMTPTKRHKNVFLFGIRQNNAVIPSSEIPTKIMKDEGRTWQRWPSEFGSNINVFTYQNCVIANCKLNDQITDDFDQQNYLTDGFYNMKGEEGKFHYLHKDVIAINSNFHKTYYNQNQVGRYDFDEAWDIPYIPSEGVEVIDNQVFASLSYEIYIDKSPAGNVTGNSYLYYDNIKTDGLTRGNTYKDYGFKEFLTPDGREALANDWNTIAKSDKIFQVNRFITEKSDTLPYRLMKPEKLKAGEKYPLILYFHGLWEAGNDNITQLKHSVTLFAREGVRKDFPAYVVCPQHPIGQSFIKWGGEEAPSWPMQATMDLLDQLIKNEQVDPKRIYVFGVSSGGSATMEALFRYPKKFSAGMILGSLFNGFTEENYVNKIKNIPLWFFFGDKDPDYPVTYIKLAMYRLRQGGSNPKVTIYPNTGHGVFVKVFEEPQLMNWLFSQKK